MQFILRGFFSYYFSSISELLRLLGVQFWITKAYISEESTTYHF